MSFSRKRSRKNSSRSYRASRVGPGPARYRSGLPSKTRFFSVVFPISCPFCISRKSNSPLGLHPAKDLGGLLCSFVGFRGLILIPEGRVSPSRVLRRSFLLTSFIGSVKQFAEHVGISNGFGLNRLSCRISPAGSRNSPAACGFWLEKLVPFWVVGRNFQLPFWLV